MRMLSHRRDLVVWTSSAAPPRRPPDRGCARVARGGRIRWWLRTGALLTVIGVRRLARIMRAHKREAFLVTGTLLTVMGIALGSMATFCCGMLVWAIARPWHWDESPSR